MVWKPIDFDANGFCYIFTYNISIYNIMKVKYIRWSSVGQSGERQLLNKADFHKIYHEQISGVVAMEKRPMGGKMLGDIINGKITELWVEEVSRLGRDTIDVMKTIRLCEEKGVCICIENMGLRSIERGKPNSVFKLVTSILATMAESEKQNIAERTTMGRIAARQRGVRFGRKEGERESVEKFLSKPKVQPIVNMIRKKPHLTIRELAELNRCSLNLVLKVK